MLFCVSSTANILVYKSTDVTEGREINEEGTTSDHRSDDRIGVHRAISSNLQLLFFHNSQMSLKTVLIAALAITGATASNTRLRAAGSDLKDCPKKNGEEEGRVLDCKKGRYFVTILSCLCAVT